MLRRARALRMNAYVLERKHEHDTSPRYLGNPFNFVGHVLRRRIRARRGTRGVRAGGVRHPDTNHRIADHRWYCGEAFPRFSKIQVTAPRRVWSARHATRCLGASRYCLSSGALKDHSCVGRLLLSRRRRDGLGAMAMSPGSPHVIEALINNHLFLAQAN